MRRTILRASVGALAAGSLRSAGRASMAVPERQRKWAVFYGTTADEALLSSYDTVILDSMFQGSITAIDKTRTTVCGYVSLGEVRESDLFFAHVDPAALLEESPDWPGTRRIDPRHPSWTDLIIRKIIPFIDDLGFNGLMFDTLDTPAYLEQLDPKANAGMRDAAVSLVRAIRRSRPDMKIIMNRGYALLPDVIDSIDAIIAESLLTSPDKTSASGYKWNDPPEVDLHLSLLASTRNRPSPMPVLSLDYWSPDDTTTIADIYARERALGHEPYVATRLLDKIVPEPTRT